MDGLAVLVAIFIVATAAAMVVFECRSRRYARQTEAAVLRIEAATRRTEAVAATLMAWADTIEARRQSRSPGPGAQT